MKSSCLLAASLLGIAASVWLTAPPRARAAGALAPYRPIVVPGGPGGYDWMAVDAPMHRLLAAHKGKGTLVVLNLNTEASPKSVPTGAAQGIAIDARDNKYFVGDEAEQKVVVLNRKTLAKIGEIKVSGPVDCANMDPRNDRLYADHDDGTEVWVIDARTNKLIGHVSVPGAPEYVEYDPVTDRLYQNIKENNTIQVIDPVTNKVVATWPTDPATGPHGLAIDRTTNRLFTAGNNGKLAVLDIKTGKLIADATIAPGVDQIAFDLGKKRVYCACRGYVSVVEETADGARLLDNITIPRGAHTLAVDPRTHAVWISYADAHDSYLMKLMP